MASSDRVHHIRGFREVDQLEDAQAHFIRLLDLHDTFEAICASRDDTIERFTTAGYRACLDVGCGTGTFAIQLAQALPDGGSTTGVDLSDTMITIARQRAAEQGVDVAFATADALELPFDDDDVDAARAERVFMYLDDPARGIAEMARVTRPGGMVVISDWTIETFFWAVPGLDPSIPPRIKAAGAAALPNPYIGRELWHLMKRAGLENLTLRTDVLLITDGAIALDEMGQRQQLTQLGEQGVLTPEEAAETIALTEAAQRSGEFLAGYIYFTVSGQVPA